MRRFFVENLGLEKCCFNLERALVEIDALAGRQSDCLCVGVVRCNRDFARLTGWANDGTLVSNQIFE